MGGPRRRGPFFAGAEIHRSVIWSGKGTGGLDQFFNSWVEFFPGRWGVLVPAMVGQALIFQLMGWDFGTLISILRTKRMERRYGRKLDPHDTGIARTVVGR